MRSVEFETRIGGVPSVVVATVCPDQGDNWNEPFIPAHVTKLTVLNMRGKPCKWRQSRLTDDEYQRIEAEAIAHHQNQEEFV